MCIYICIYIYYTSICFHKMMCACRDAWGPCFGSPNNQDSSNVLGYMLGPLFIATTQSEGYTGHIGEYTYM